MGVVTFGGEEGAPHLNLLPWGEEGRPPRRARPQSLPEGGRLKVLPLRGRLKVVVKRGPLISVFSRGEKR